MTSIIETNSDYIYQPLLSYMGNKRRLLPEIEKYVIRSKNRSSFRCFDGFCGSGVVARMLRFYATELWINDLEPYAVAIQKGHLTANTFIPSSLDDTNAEIESRIRQRTPPEWSLITRYYSPQSTTSIHPGERCFYTRENAERLDHSIQILHEMRDGPERDALISTLLTQASIHTNTGGVFKGFFKVGDVGHWGGRNDHDTQRIFAPIQLRYPIQRDTGCTTHFVCGDTQSFWRDHYRGPDFDFVYYDPPYNQHPYGSNYFMLNVILDAIQRGPESIRSLEERVREDSVSGIPVDWTRSSFNYKHSALRSFEELMEHTRSRTVLLSYNNNGFVSQSEMMELLGSYGRVEVEPIQYRNMNSRPKQVAPDKVEEYLFYVVRED